MRSELKDAKPPRVRIKRVNSKYFNCLGFIIRSGGDGTFLVEISTEGNPQLDLFPEEIEPC